MTLVEDGKDIYKDLYENTKVSEKTVDYWKNAVELYHSFDDKQKDVFANIVSEVYLFVILHRKSAQLVQEIVKSEILNLMQFFY